MKQSLQCERGAPAFEFLLYLPIALTFLFVASDVGLAFVQRSAMSDVVRSGMNFETLCASRVERETLFLEDRRAQVFATETARCIADQMVRALESKSILGGTLSSKDYHLTIKLIALQIDPGTGALLGYISTPISPKERSAGSFRTEDVFGADPSTPFLKERLADEWERIPTSFAMPTGLITDPSRLSPPRLRYLEATFGLYARLDFVPRGFNTPFSSAILGTPRTTRIEHFSTLRRQQEG